MTVPDERAAVVSIRHARREDVAAIVALLADDPLGAEREQRAGELPAAYVRAFERIDADPAHELVVAERDGTVIGTMHLTYLPGLSFQGGTRLHVESMRVAVGERNRGIGTGMMEWAIDRGRERDCRMVQLFTHESRTDARRFYERLGFAATHAGMKLDL